MVVRLASRDDALAIVRLSEELGYPNTVGDIADRLSRLETDPCNAILVSIDESGSVVGCVHVLERLLLIGGRYAELGGMIVASEVRGQGYGRELMRAAEEWARERGLSQLRLKTGAERAGAHLFYERLGYVHRKDQRVYAREL